MYKRQILYLSRQDFEDWIAKDIHFLRLVAAKVALKLYRSSYNRGAKLFYPPQFLLLDYLINYVESAFLKIRRQCISSLKKHAMYCMKKLASV